MANADRVDGGRFYERAPDGRLRPAAPGPPDVWICRRVADFPRGLVPAGGTVDACTHCQAPIVFNAARPVAAARVCMQCAGIEPLPIEAPGKP